MTARLSILCLIVTLFVVSCGGGTRPSVTNDASADVPFDAPVDGTIVSDGRSNDVAVEAPTDGGIHLCDEISCPKGCCSSDGVCITTFSAAACGYGGTGCMACPAGASCEGGACVTPTPNCGPANCPGCCQGTDLCASGMDNVACGQGGESCASCVPGSCAAQTGGGGQCSACGGCHGCCRSASYCAFGLAQDECGTNGENCRKCAADQQCVLASTTGGTCTKANPACNSTNCMGCCQGDLCAVGNQDVACGVNGEICLNCAVSLQKCSQQAACM